jgi:transposase
MFHKLSTLSELLEATKARPGDCMVMDKGMATKANLEWLMENKYCFIVADRRIKREFDPNKA